MLRGTICNGASKAALARRFGVSRRTIHEWVETGQLDRDLSSGGARYSMSSRALAPYTGIIEAREEFPGLSAKRLFDAARRATPVATAVCDYVRRYARASRSRLVRFETPAGRQGQVDFATFAALGPPARPGGGASHSRCGCASTAGRRRC